MPTNGISIPDIDKVILTEGEEANEDTWIELTNCKGNEEDDEDE